MYNPQDWNRYSYVRNNPLRYTDPTGHWQDEERAGKRGCSNSLYCTNGQIKSKQELAFMRWASREARRREEEGRGGGAVIGPSTTTIGSAPENQNDSGFSELIDGVGILNNAYEFVSDLGISTRLLKKGFLWGKALNPNPLLDFGLGFAGQAISDLDNPKLTPLQRTNRAVAIGGESLITGVAADLAGGLGFLGGEAIVPEGGGIVGYAAAAAATSLYLDEVAWNNFNASIFPEYGLGAYP